MRRVRYQEYGGPEVLRVEEVEVPEPGPGQVLLRTEAVGANFVDTKFRRGGDGIFHRPLPGILTGDVVGSVVAVGDGVTGVAAGERVAALAEDAFADQVVVDADWLVPVPAGMDAATASMLPMGGPVALGALRAGRLAAGESVLVHAAAGGIGHLVVQLARALGAGTVVATAGSAAKLDFARSLGADVAVDYTAPDWPDRVREALPGGVDVVADAVGGDVLLRSLDLLAPLGRLAAYGVASGGGLVDVPLGSLFALRSVTGFSLLAQRAGLPELARAQVAESAGHLATGRVRVTLAATFPLVEAAAAHRLLEDRGQLGRILIVP
jgi:NADPH:quinone reductase-like Zn-dependent oxidoreductase